VWWGAVSSGWWGWVCGELHGGAGGGISVYGGAVCWWAEGWGAVFVSGDVHCGAEGGACVCGGSGLWAVHERGERGAWVFDECGLWGCDLFGGDVPVGVWGWWGVLRGRGVHEGGVCGFAGLFFHWAREACGAVCWGDERRSGMRSTWELSERAVCFAVWEGGGVQWGEQGRAGVQFGQCVSGRGMQCGVCGEESGGAGEHFDDGTDWAADWFSDAAVWQSWGGRAGAGSDSGWGDAFRSGEGAWDFVCVCAGWGGRSGARAWEFWFWGDQLWGWDDWERGDAGAGSQHFAEGVFCGGECGQCVQWAQRLSGEVCDGAAGGASVHGQFWLWDVFEQSIPALHDERAVRHGEHVQCWGMRGAIELQCGERAWAVPRGVERRQGVREQCAVCGDVHDGAAGGRAVSWDD